MCSTVPKVIGATAAPIASTPGGAGHQQARRQVDPLLREAVQMEAVHARHVLAEIVAPFPAGAAEPAGPRAVDRNQLPRHQAGTPGPIAVNLAGRLGADRQRQLALGERHAAPAPDVDMVERHGLDGKRHLAGSGGRRRGHVDRLQPAVLDELQCAHNLRSAATA